MARAAAYQVVYERGGADAAVRRGGVRGRVTGRKRRKVHVTAVAGRVGGGTAAELVMTAMT